MPLVKETFQNALKVQIENQLKTEFKNPVIIEKLRKQLDGGSEQGKKTNAVDINTALSNIKTVTQQLSQTPSAILNSQLQQIEERIRYTSSNEWANGISNSVCEWLSNTIAPMMAENLSTIIANNVDLYIRSASIVIPPGQALAAGPAVGSTTAPSPPAIIS